MSNDTNSTNTVATGMQLDHNNTNTVATGMQSYYMVVIVVIGTFVGSMVLIVSALLLCSIWTRNRYGDTDDDTVHSVEVILDRCRPLWAERSCDHIEFSTTRNTVSFAPDMRQDEEQSSNRSDSSTSNAVSVATTNDMRQDEEQLSNRSECYVV
jgi:hypothetical protein